MPYLMFNLAVAIAVVWLVWRDHDGHMETTAAAMSTPVVEAAGSGPRSGSSTPASPAPATLPAPRRDTRAKKVGDATRVTEAGGTAHLEGTAPAPPVSMASAIPASQAPQAPSRLSVEAPPLDAEIDVAVRPTFRAPVPPATERTRPTSVAEVGAVTKASGGAAIGAGPMVSTDPVAAATAPEASAPAISRQALRDIAEDMVLEHLKRAGVR